jgi:predicted ATPase with chaperone activity
LPDAAVRESRDRVRAAIKNCGYQYPVSRITINMAPANVRKVGSVYDLPLLLGIDGFMVQVEADISKGLPGFDVVGLPDAAVRESRDRVRAVIKNAGFTYPVSRITVNLAPADVKKEGPVYDLPLFLALLKASDQL